jgi:hypothetical protein
VVEGFANEYVLPISQRDETGELEEPVTKVVETIRWGKEFVPNMMTSKI